MRENLKKIIFFISVGLLLAVCSGCAFTGRAGLYGSGSYQKEVYDKVQGMSKEELIALLKRSSVWPGYRIVNPPASKRLKLEYYSVNDRLQKMISDEDVYHTYHNLAYNSSGDVARDAVRVMSAALSSRDDVRDAFVEIYKNKHTHSWARKEILHVLVERKIVIPELIFYIEDFPEFDRDLFTAQELYISFARSAS